MDSLNTVTQEKNVEEVPVDIGEFVIKVINSPLFSQLYVWKKNDRVSDRILNDGMYAKVMTRFVLAMASRYRFMIDVGAHIGYVSNVFAKEAKKTFTGANAVEVLCFEPSQANRALLELNTDWGNRANAIISPYALGSEDDCGERSLHQSEVNYGDHQVGWADLPKKPSGGMLERVLHHEPTDSKGYKERTMQQIECRTFDSVGLKWNDDPESPVIEFTTKAIQNGMFVKIDAQGYDLKVLQGMMGTLEQCGRCTILFEFWPFLIHQLDIPYLQVIDGLQGLGYRFKRYGTILNKNDLMKYYVKTIANKNAMGFCNIVMEKH